MSASLPVGDPTAGERVAVVVDPALADPAVESGALAAVVGPGIRACVRLDQLAELVGEVEASRRPRWTWWAAGHDALPLVAARVPLARCWDIAEAHRVAVGGWDASPQLAWATAHGV